MSFYGINFVQYMCIQEKNSLIENFYEAKEEDEKGGSHLKSNPKHLTCTVTVLHWATWQPDDPQSSHLFSLFQILPCSTTFYWCVHMVRALAVQARVPPVAANLSLSSIVLHTIERCVFWSQTFRVIGRLRTWSWAHSDYVIWRRGLPRSSHTFGLDVSRAVD